MFLFVLPCCISRYLMKFIKYKSFNLFYKFYKYVNVYFINMKVLVWRQGVVWTTVVSLSLHLTSPCNPGLRLMTSLALRQISDLKVPRLCQGLFIYCHSLIQKIMDSSVSWVIYRLQSSFGNSTVCARVQWRIYHHYLFGNVSYRKYC